MNENQATSRREFLQSTAAVVGGALAATAAPAPKPTTLRIGLIGCGGRGTGAASQALNADPDVKLVAMGDAFRDRLESSLERLQNDTAKNLESSPERLKGDAATLRSKIDVPPERQFVGFDAYKQVIASGVDVVLLATPPHFRPAHLKAAVDAGKHVFAEKPVAVDAPGVRSVLATCEEAKKKKLSIVSGLCLRYHNGFRETVARIHDGAIGKIVALQANDYRGKIWTKPRQPDWSDMEWQLRNWYYFTWLSGDFNVEQHVHYLDVCTWLMQEKYPVKAVGMGGRQVRTGEEHGNIYDHFSVVYEYDDGAKLFSNCRQQPFCANDMSAWALGSKGTALVAERGFTIGDWRFKGPENNPYQTEHDELFASIRSGQPINNGKYMAYNTLMAIMGRMAAYTGKAITWEMALDSKEDLTPAKYEWGQLAMPPVAMPGQTKFV